jgi:hypothetical protein
VRDFIYDDQGACVARIVDGEVFSETSKQRIATIRDGNIYALGGELVGHLQGAGFVRKEGDSTPEAFTRLLGKVCPRVENIAIFRLCREVKDTA